MNSYMKAWIEALRSGKYEQGVKRLRDEDKMCCLGVACDVIDPDGWEKSPSGDNGGVEWFWKSLYSSLDIETQGLLSLDTEAQNRLIDFNDRCTYDFNFIADWLEEKFGKEN